MRNLFRAMAVSAAGAAAMYYLDPEQGRRRRNQVRDKLGSVSHEAGDYARAKGRLAADRARGLAATTRASLTGASYPRSDRQLRERIRSQLGRLVSHPRAIEVVVNQGNVSLRGLVLAEEADPLLRMVLAMQGVKHIDDRLQRHDEPGSIPALQGRPRRRKAGGAVGPSLLPLVALAAPLAMLLRKARAVRRAAGASPRPH